MEKRSARVSEAQWSILIDYLESNPNLARSRAYNNSAQGRAETLRLWQSVTTLLNAEGSGTTKSPKEWSVYVSNYKSKLKKMVADINTDTTATGGGSPRASTLSDMDRRFLALLGPGFGQTAPQVMVHPFSEQPSTSVTASESQILMLELADDAENSEDRNSQVDLLEIEVPSQARAPSQATTPPRAITPPAIISRLETNEPILPRQRRQRRLRTRPLAPLDEARRILSEVETQRAAADAANARAMELVAYNLSLLGDVAQNLGRLAGIAERYVNNVISRQS